METVTFSPVALLGGTGMILVALGFVLYAAVRRLGWGYMGLGALAWVITVAVKFLWALPVNPRLYPAITQALPGALGAGLFDLYVGLMTGFTEVAIVWLVMRYTRLGRVPWQRALAFGIGFGAIEALLLGLGSFAAALTALLAPQTFPAQTLDQLAVMNDVLYGVAPIVERFFTVWVHIFCSVLIFFAVAKSEARWFWLSFWFKSLLDAVAGFAQTSGVIASAEGIWAIEAVVVLFGIAGWLGVRWLAQRYPAPSAEPGPKRRVGTELATAGFLVLVILLMSAGAVGAVALQDKTLTGSDKDAVLAYTEPKTTNLLTAIDNRDYAAFSRDLNDRMKSAITADGLTAMRAKVSDKIGKYVSREVTSVTPAGEFITVIYTARFENDDPVTVRVSFEAAEPHRVSGLYFDSAKLR